MSILIETDIIEFPMFWSKKWVDRLICTGTWKKDITLQTLEISTLVHLICKEFRTFYLLATINMFLLKWEYCFATSNISWEKSVFWPRNVPKNVVIMKGEGLKEPLPCLSPSTKDTAWSKYGETLVVIGFALNPQLRELLEQTFAAFSPPLCVRKTSICQNMKKFGERKILFVVSSSQSFDQKWQNSSPAKSPV